MTRKVRQEAIRGAPPKGQARLKWPSVQVLKALVLALVAGLGARACAGPSRAAAKAKGACFKFEVRMPKRCPLPLLAALRGAGANCGRDPGLRSSLG